MESERSCICVLAVIDFASFYDCDIELDNCSDSVVLFVFSIYFHDFDIGFWNCFWTVWNFLFSI
jgi:hypothetical protein